MVSNHKSALEFTAIFQAAPEGGFTVTVPSLPGCISEGDTFEEAKQNIQEAIALYLEVFDQADHKDNTRDETFSAPVQVNI